MILSDRDIIANIESGNIVCTPLDLANISNSSIDLRLGQYIAVQPRRWFSWFRPVKFEIDSSGRLTVLNVIKPKIYNLLDPKIRDSHKCVIRPGQLFIAQTLELTGSMSDLIECKIADKSTLARLGLSVCFSAGKIESGNVLRVTLELRNNGANPIELRFGQHIAQIQFEQLSSPVLRKYDGKYKGSLNLDLAK